MATDLERLVVRLEAQLTQFDREMRRAAGISDRAARDVERRFRTMNSRLDSIGRGMARSLLTPLAGIGIAISAREVLQYADAWTVAGNKLAAAGTIAGRQARSLEEINEIATRTRSGIIETTDLYAKLLRSTANVAKSEEEVARATEIINKSFKAGGAALSEQVAGILQLSQALGSGLLQGDELRSIRENAPLLAQAIADEFKTTIGGLKALGAEGKLTVDRVFQAILKAQPQIEAAFASTNQTIGESFTRVNNAFTEYIGHTDEGLGASARLTQALNALADNFDETADVVLKVAGVIAGALVGRALGGLITGAARGAGAMRVLFSAVRAGTGVWAALGGAMGPISLLLGGIAFAAYTFSGRSAEAADRTERLRQEMRDLGIIADEAADSIDATTKSIDDLASDERRQKLREIAAEISRIRTEGGGLFSAFGAQDTLRDIRATIDRLQALPRGLRLPISDLGILGEIERYVVHLERSEIAAEDVLKKIDEWSQVDLTQPVDELLTQLRAVAEEFRGLVEYTDRVISTPPRSTSFPQGSPRRIEDASMAALEVSRASGASFAEEQRRRAALTEAERDLEDEVKRLRETLEKEFPGAILSPADLEALARANLASRGTSTGTGFPDAAVSQFVNRVVAAESSGNASARNPKSTATGLGQFIESTWLRLFRENFPDRAREMSNATILALRTDADISRSLIEAYAKENANILRAAGVSVNEAALHLAHFLGPGGAAKVLTAAPGTPIASLLSAGAIRANPTILGGGATVEDVIAYANRRANATRIAAGDLTEQEEAANQLRESVDGVFTSIQRETVAIDSETAALGRSIYEREKLRAVMELENRLRDAGVANIEDYRGQIDELAETYARAAEQAALAADSVEAMEDAVEEASEVLGGALKGFVKDLVAGKSAAEALGNVLARIGDKLIDTGIDALIGSLFNTGFGGGLAGVVGRIFGGSRDSGGPVLPGRAYEIGKGPYREIFVPRVPGVVTPMGQGVQQSSYVEISVTAGEMFDARVARTAGPVSAAVSRRQMADAQDRQRRGLR